MKRHVALQPWSRDHHVHLLHARRLRGDDPRWTPAKALANLDAYREQLDCHLAEEHALLSDAVAGTPLALAWGNHRAAMNAALEGREPEAIGEALRDLVRFEEQELFEHIQAHLDDAAAQKLAHSVALLQERRPPDTCRM